jgi:hypothetical protein
MRNYIQFCCDYLDVEKKTFTELLYEGRVESGRRGTAVDLVINEL